MAHIKRHVLVVDDSPTSCLAIAKQLEALGCEVTTAKEGKTALALIGKIPFDVVLLDCFMPGMDGFEVAHIVRANEAAQGEGHTPIIAISGDDDAQHVARCLESGMDGVLHKPLPAGELQKILALWCGVAQTATPSITTMSEEELHALFVRTSLDDFTALEEVVSKRDWQAAGRLIHRMKGAALTMRAKPLAQALLGSEELLKADSPNAEALQAAMQVLKHNIQAL